MRVLIAAVACWGIACAAAPSTVPATDYRVTDALLFDNSVDLVPEPVTVEGERGAFERRVGRADVIVSIAVRSLSSELIKRRSAYRLDVKVVDRFKGSSANTLSLRVTDEEPGHRTVAVNEDRLLQEPFIAFIKWEVERASDGPTVHWHLSPDTPAVRDKIAFVLRRRAPDPHTQVEVVEPQ